MPSPRVTWLHTNRRALGWGLIVLTPLLVGTIGGSVMLPQAGLRWTAAALAALLTYLLVLCIYLMFQPRLSYADDQLYVRLRSGPPIQVPIELVECFFLGQGPALLPRRFSGSDSVEETSTIVVRLAESAEQWKHFDVKPALGLWCDGYITIRGTWCEPITNVLLKRLNENLVAAHRVARDKTPRQLASLSTPTPPTREQEVG